MELEAESSDSAVHAFMLDGLDRNPDYKGGDLWTLVKEWDEKSGAHQYRRALIKGGFHMEPSEFGSAAYVLTGARFVAKDLNGEANESG